MIFVIFLREIWNSSTHMNGRNTFHFSRTRYIYIRIAFTKNSKALKKTKRWQRTFYTNICTFCLHFVTGHEPPCFKFQISRTEYQGASLLCARSVFKVVWDKNFFFSKFCFFKYILHEYDRISVADTKYVNEISCYHGNQETTPNREVRK